MGNSRKATQPTSRTPTIKSVVATGRRMNGRDGLIAGSLRHCPSTGSPFVADLERGTEMQDRGPRHSNRLPDWD